MQKNLWLSAKCLWDTVHFFLALFQMSVRHCPACRHLNSRRNRHAQEGAHSPMVLPFLPRRSSHRIDHPTTQRHFAARSSSAAPHRRFGHLSLSSSPRGSQNCLLFFNKFITCLDPVRYSILNLDNTVHFRGADFCGWAFEAGACLSATAYQWHDVHQAPLTGAGSGELRSIAALQAQRHESHWIVANQSVGHFCSWRKFASSGCGSRRRWIALQVRFKNSQFLDCSFASLKKRVYQFI